MFSFRKMAAFGLLWLTFAAVAFSAPIAVNMNITAWDYPILNGGRFQMSLDGSPSFSVFCDDYQNIISQFNTSFSAWESDAADLSKTRFGTLAPSGFSYNPPALTAIQRYTMAAWLTTQFTFPTSGGNPAPTDADKGVQTAIWTLLSQTGASPSVVPNQATLDLWLGNALAHKDDAVIRSAMRIVTTQDVAVARDRFHSGQQEYIFLTPEPTPYLMIGSGLLALALRRRRSA
jgi:hypothetical protein